MKSLIVFYSLEGNTRFIAQTIAEEIKGDILELKPVNDIKQKGFMRYLWGGKQAMSKKIPELKPFDKNPNDYDLIVIGTPVWAFTFAPALRAFYSKNKIQNKKIALFCCHGGGKAGTLNKMKEQLTGNNIVGEIDFMDPLIHNKEDNARKAKEWARKIVK